jgi:hypothetical protein
LKLLRHILLVLRACHRIFKPLHKAVLWLLILPGGSLFELGWRLQVFVNALELLLPLKQFFRRGHKTFWTPFESPQAVNTTTSPNLLSQRTP